jgi:hypothetical protein
VLDTWRDEPFGDGSRLKGASAYDVKPRSFVLLVERDEASAPEPRS